MTVWGMTPKPNAAAAVVPPSRDSMDPTMDGVVVEERVERAGRRRSRSIRRSGSSPHPSRDLQVRSSTVSSPRASGTFASFPIPPPPPPASASIEWGRFSMRPREVVEMRRRWERPLLPQPEPPRVVASFLSPRRRMTTTTRSL
jgi:hypothetical protein